MNEYQTNSPTLRQKLRLRRQQLSTQQQQQHAVSACQSFIELLDQQTNKAQKIALFLAQDGELETKQLIEHLWQTPHQTYLPVLETQPQWHMAFAEYNANSEMHQNRFDIAEPKTPHQQHLDGQQLDWVLMPLVGFDKHGNRLGMGGGYYDRTFAFKNQDENTTGNDCRLIGWAHSCQQVDELFAEEWDVPLDGIITELGFTAFKGGL